MSPTSQSEPVRYRYLVLFSKGPNWREGCPFKEQPEAGRHGEYMGRLRGEGLLILGVPLADASGSVALLQARSLAEALQLVEGDPMVQAEVMRGDLYEWKAAVSST